MGFSSGLNEYVFLTLKRLKYVIERFLENYWNVERIIYINQNSSASKKK